MNHRTHSNGWLRVAALTAALALSGCSVTLVYDDAPSPLLQPESEYPLSNEIVHLYVTVLPQDKGKGERYGYTFDETNAMGRADILSKDPLFDVIVREGTSEGPPEEEVSEPSTEANATLELRGNMALNDVQKSYKIRLDDDTELWQGQNTLNLNKHYRDLTRVRNKLSYDYFAMIPDLVSLRTQFVHLHVKDESDGVQGGDFEDYGLYTHVEEVNETLLASRKLDPYGQLYKAVGFGFFRYEDQLKLVTDPTYDEAAFESVLEVEGSQDHRKLISMLDAVNDPTTDFVRVFDKYFDRDNYFTWMAVNILFGNLDTFTFNYYIYSPSNSQRWYFIPWDYDRTFRNFEWFGGSKQPMDPWKAGLSNWWGVKLHQRVIQTPELMEGLQSKIEALGGIVTEERTRELLNGYYNAVKPIVTQGSDAAAFPKEIGQFDEEFERVAGMPAFYKHQFYELLEKPMPVFVATPSANEGKLRFVWDSSYDVQGDAIAYDFEIGTDPHLSNPIVSVLGLSDTTYEVDPPAPGTYYVRVTVKDAAGHTQVSYGAVIGEDGAYIFGVNEFTVE
ncbi:CotH kinase family protein [Paenibacillus sp.]|uniref:CotH kinase family protein n=1 Tax=Paenibacillus sp. TaxID=58172 RepID=UPI0028113ACA|nr:CotH kinase family protein [Paenibacillus sp.]